MKKKTINSLQLGCLILCPVLSASIGIGLYNAIQIAGVDNYISIFLSIFIGLIPLAMIIYIAKFREDLNLIEKIINLYGKYLGTIINLAIVIIMFVIAITVLFNICNFIVTQFLSNTPILYVAIVFGIISFYAVSKGIETISRTQLIFSFIIALIFIGLSITLLPEFDTSNLKPILENGLEKPMWTAILNVFTNVIPIFVILIIPKTDIVDKHNYNKYVIIFYFLAAFFILAFSVFTTGVLGQYLSKFYQYPEYILLKRVSIFGFIDRIENLLSFQWIFSCFATLTLIIYYISNFIKKNDQAKLIPLIITTIIVITSTYIFKNNTTFNIYVNTIYPYLLSILLIIMFIVCMTIFIKKKLIIHSD